MAEVAAGDRQELGLKLGQGGRVELLKKIWNPSDRQLRQFAVAMTIAAGIVCFWKRLEWPVWAGVILGFAAVSAVAWIWPKVIKPVYIGLSLLTLPIRLVVQELLLVAVYVFLFVPVGLWFKLIGRDALKRKWLSEAETYWEDAPPPRSPKSYYRQF